MNGLADKLAVTNSTLQPSDEMINGNGKMEINFQPSIYDNLDHWQVFNDDKQLLRFIHNLQEFEDCKISYQQEDKEYKEHEDNVKNHISSSLISFENLFDRQDRHKNEKETIKIGDYVEIDIGTDKDPMLIKIGKGTSEKERNNLINLIKEYRGVLAFSYDERKAYQEDVFQHTIPIKE